MDFSSRLSFSRSISGLVQLILFYFGMHFVLEPKSEAQALMQIAVVYISLFAIMPLMIFATARGAMMARTRFMGIRFGMDKVPGAMSGAPSRMGADRRHAGHPAAAPDLLA
ncbi:MAG: hypothetical protein R3D46_04315 [Defluviimonas denitrificans]